MREFFIKFKTKTRRSAWERRYKTAIQQTEIAMRLNESLIRENKNLKGLLKEAEDDLYHICFFNPEVKSASYSKISKYLNASSIGETESD